MASPQAFFYGTGRRKTSIARVRALRGSQPEYDRSVWRKMGELGWLGILVPEEYGGLGLAMTEAAIVAQGLARALTRCPPSSRPQAR